MAGAMTVGEIDTHDGLDCEGVLEHPLGFLCLSLYSNERKAKLKYQNRDCHERNYDEPTKSILYKKLLAVQKF